MNFEELYKKNPIKFIFILGKFSLNNGKLNVGKKNINIINIYISEVFEKYLEVFLDSKFSEIFILYYIFYTEECKESIISKMDFLKPKELIKSFRIWMMHNDEPIIIERIIQIKKILNKRTLFEIEEYNSLIQRINSDNDLLNIKVNNLFSKDLNLVDVTHIIYSYLKYFYNKNKMHLYLIQDKVIVLLNHIFIKYPEIIKDETIFYKVAL